MHIYQAKEMRQIYHQENLMIMASGNSAKTYIKRYAKSGMSLILIYLHHVWITKLIDTVLGSQIQMPPILMHFLWIGANSKCLIYFLLSVFWDAAFEKYRQTKHKQWSLFHYGRLKSGLPVLWKYWWICQSFHQGQHNSWHCQNKLSVTLLQRNWCLFHAKCPEFLQKTGLF